MKPTNEPVSNQQEQAGTQNRFSMTKADTRDESLEQRSSKTIKRSLGIMGVAVGLMVLILRISDDPDRPGLTAVRVILGVVVIILFSIAFVCFARKYVMRPCKKCGDTYSIGTARLGSGICGRCQEAECTAERARQTESAKMREMPVASSHKRVEENGLFYCKVRSDEQGPYTFKQLTSMWESGQLTADALYRTSDSSEWIPLMQRFAEGRPLGQPTNEPVPNQQEQAATQNRFSSGMGWLKKVSVVGGVALAVICGIAFFNSGTNNGGRAPGSSSPSHRSQKSDRQLIKDYASSHYGKIESIDIDSYTDGSYQVKIYAASGYQGMGYKTSTFKVGVNSSAQAITSWQYVGE